jgi:hypothetical protein
MVFRISAPSASVLKASLIRLENTKTNLYLALPPLLLPYYNSMEISNTRQMARNVSIIIVTEFIGFG